MEFTLHYNEAEFSHISLDGLKELFQRLEDEDYIILIPSEPIAQSVFLQVKHEQSNNYHVEIRLEYEGENQFKQYAIDTMDVSECEQWFTNYFAGELPNVANWHDLTDYLKTYYYDAEIGLSKEQVHPNFAKICTDDFYYSISDYHSPFGNDQGFDAMNDTESFLKMEEENMYYIIHLIAEELLDSEDVVEQTLQIQKVISAGFCSVKVNGFIMRDTKEHVEEALLKMNRLQPHSNYKTMLVDLQKVEMFDYGS
ncbi:hypothetical protein ACFSTH_05665 [Paenibacillus yanchengensis]|uniref:Uncharacterized protein n=1 Tax=Paenibacillus yanchengensis TaxID=2035833 RepID=A0ABW4YI54_9BACL